MLSSLALSMLVWELLSCLQVWKMPFGLVWGQLLLLGLLSEQLLWGPVWEQLL